MHSSEQCLVQRAFCNRIHIRLLLVTFRRCCDGSAPYKPSRTKLVAVRFGARVAGSQIFPLWRDAQLSAVGVQRASMPMKMQPCANRWET
ncbi:hypothetical protein Bphy_1740 [Paraburkholderia phymatum STM815]|uniref:Uncharacterized protein n=1 Tax=Paraburkholderia phymatum (strain DSM 17167 / CIP 108236 / LMG 21445 / STM815) TaxID=391038 RepID=B2JKU5_PARP8|nr:hypothetical protein Bphy_1740 [Paraburkholderia phymatum STM815]